MIEVSAQRQLKLLVGSLGMYMVVQNLGINEETVLKYRDGELPIESSLGDDIEDMYERMKKLVPLIEDDDGVTSEMALGVDLDNDGKIDIDLEDIGLSTRDVTWNENMELRRQSLHANHSLAMMTQFRLGIPYQQKIAALGMVTQIELALISFFKESVPEANESWDGARRAREIESRLHTLRWVEREQEKEYGGFKGVLNWVVGRTKQSGKEIQKRMMDDASGVLDALSEDGPSLDAVKMIMEFTGGEYLIKE